MKTRQLPLILLLVIASCTTQDVCDDDNQAILVARFKTIANGETTDTILPGISIYGIREGQPDSLLYDSMLVSRVELPLDPSNDQSRYVMTIAEETDTLFLIHSSEAYLISYSCGFAARFTLEDFTATGKMIVDTELISASIDAELESDEVHLWIYF
jgi:hypothetical protein